MNAEPRPRGESNIDSRHLDDLDRDDLSRMVREVNDTGVSYQEMADRAAAAGYPVSKPYLQKLATNAVTQAPNPERLRGIAAATGRPLRAVKEAAAVQYLQYETRELAGYGSEVRVIVAHLAGMDPAEVRRWRALIEADERARRERDEPN